MPRIKDKGPDIVPDKGAWWEEPLARAAGWEDAKEGKPASPPLMFDEKEQESYHLGYENYLEKTRTKVVEEEFDLYATKSTYKE